MKLMLIEWKDSRFMASGGWQCKEHCQDTQSDSCVSVGIILRETDDTIILYPNTCKGDYSQGILIPKTSIIRMRQLKLINPQKFQGESKPTA